MKHVFLLLSYVLLLASAVQAQRYTDHIGLGNDMGVQVYTSHRADPDLPGEKTLDGFTPIGPVSLADASRFLAQASFGADYTLIEAVKETGYEAWIQEQIGLPISYVTPNIQRVLDRVEELGEEPLDEEERNFSLFFRSAWWETILNADDQLRHRVALALSEIFVISDRSDELFLAGDGIGSYYDMLLDNAFGNYRDLLMDVTLHPCMGFYLSHFNNPKGNPELNRRPDENYAREIQQLFSIGLYELNPDGSRKVDDSGRFIPTYDNEDIREFAEVFTGLKGGAWNKRYIEEAERQGQTLPEEVIFGLYFSLSDPTEPMVMQEVQHDPSEKFLLREVALPANRPGMEDIEGAIDNLFFHPNVGPFMARLLIQRLVMSNPSPAYIARVAAVFNDNGSGVRGDMGAVIKSILLDEEARNCQALNNPQGGMLREPILRYTHALRAFHVQALFGVHLSTGIRFQNATEQFPFNSPTVFNFFLPDFQPNGPIADQGWVAPEFQIHNNTSGLGYVNEVFNWMLEGNVLPFYLETGFDPENLGESMSYLELDREYELAGSPEDLMDYLDIVLTHGQLSESARQTIQQAVQTIPVSEPEARARLAIYLVMISPDYSIIK